MSLRAALLFAASVCVLASVSRAQPALNFSGIVLNWPEVKLQFTVKCNGRWTDTFARQHFRVFEDSIEVGEFQISCPEWRARCPIRAVLVLDASGSMLGSKNEHTIAAAKEFVNQMDGVDDRAAVIWFHSKDTLVQTMTSDRDSLRAAIEKLPAAGTTAAWDAAYDGITEILNNTLPTDSCRAVILLTDGIDNSSTRGVNDVIAYALASGIRVYTVELGDEGDAGALQTLARSTGGKYFQVTDFKLLSDIYQDIFMNLVGLDRCEIIYRSSCGDGTERQVTLQLLNFCGGTDTKYRTYLPPAEGFPGLPTIVQLGSVRAKEDSVILLPITLKTPLGDAAFPPATVLIRYDTTCVVFEGVECADTCLLKGVGITAFTQYDAIYLTIPRKLLLSGTGPLAYLRFRTRALAQSRCCDVRIDEWKTKGGCLAFTFVAGEICVVANEPLVVCAISAPDSIRWDAQVKRYVPDTLRVSATFSNVGRRTAADPVYSLSCDTNAVEGMDPPEYSVAGDPAGIAPGQSVVVTWLIRPKRGSADRVLRFCIDASFSNFPTVSCCKDVSISAAEAALICAAHAPVLRADSVRFRYTPDPLELSVSVLNLGGQTSDSVWVTISLPDGMRLSPRESTADLTRLLRPAVLKAGESGVATWLLSPEITIVSRDLDIRVVVRSRSGDSSECVLRVTVPPLNAAVLRPQCATPAVLAADTATVAYAPNPFDVSVSVTNQGNRAARDVDAQLILPPGTELVPTNDALVKRFVPAILPPYRVGDPRPTLAWRVRFLRHRTAPDILTFKWLVTYRNETAPQRDTVYAYCLVRVDPFPPRLDCRLTLPDTLRANADRTAIEPDPFTVAYRVTNVSRMDVTVDRITAAIEGIGALFLPGTPPVVDVARTLAPGDSITVQWRVIAEPRSIPRGLIVTASALDDQGNTAVCSGSTWMEGIPAVITCTMSASADTVFYDGMIGRYLPDVLTVHAQLTNNSAVVLNDLFAELRWASGIVPDPISLDSSVAGNTARQSIALCFPGQTKTFEWLLRLDRTQPVPRHEPVTFTITHGALGIQEISSGCSVEMILAPQGGAPELACSLSAVDTVRFAGNDYDPPAVTVRVRVENRGTMAATGVRIFALQDSRFKAIGATALSLPVLEAGLFAEADSLSFVFTTLPRPDDRIDTIRVAVYADGLPVQICEKRIFIEKERAPSVDVTCASPVDSVLLDPLSGAFIPDPLRITVRLHNLGDASAARCTIHLAGTAAFTPMDSSTLDAGVLAPGERRDVEFALRPLRRPVPVTDTAAFRVTYRGGYLSQLKSVECRTVITVPASGGPVYTVSCAAPDSLLISGRRYLPDPFPFHAWIRNTGLTEGKDIAVRIHPPAGITLDPAFQPVVTVQELPAGDSAQVSWMLWTERRTTDTTLALCVEVTDASGRHAACCSDMFVPAIPDRLFDLSCTAPDSLHWDAGAGGYAGIPFTVCARIGNPGPGALDSVMLAVSFSTATLGADGPSFRTVPRIAAGDAADICWDARPSIPIRDEIVVVRFTASSGSDTVRCERPVFVPAPPAPLLECTIATDPRDTLRYDPETGDYEGVPSAFGPYRIFSLEVKVKNTGQAIASGLLAVASIPSGIVLENGESAVIPLQPRLLAPGGEASATWKLRALRSPSASIQLLSASVYSDQGAGASCGTALRVDPASRYALASISPDLTARFGEEIRIPVALDSSAGKGIRSFRIQLAYDPALLGFIDASYAGTDALIGWDGPTWDVVASDSAVAQPVLIIRGGAPEPLNTERTASLLSLRFRVGADPGTAPFLIVQAPLRFVPAVRSGGRLTVGALNAPDDSTEGDVRLRYGDGMLTVTGDCVLPLRDGGGARIVANLPNPFNPATTVVYELPDAAPVRLRVFDSYGRQVRTLFEGRREAGTHRAVFDAGDLPAGMYTCVLEASGARRIRAMLLLK